MTDSTSLEDRLSRLERLVRELCADNMRLVLGGSDDYAALKPTPTTPIESRKGMLQVCGQCGYQWIVVSTREDGGVELSTQCERCGKMTTCTVTPVVLG